MQNYIDYREIVQTVTQNVMTEIVNKLNSMKPGIEQEIAEAVYSAIDSRLSKLENSLNNIQSRLTALEKKQPRNSGYAASSNGDLLNRIKRWSHKKYRGWIFYVNRDDGDFLYMIKEDGSDNKQLTNESVASIASLSVHDSSCTIHFITPTAFSSSRTVEL